MSCMDEQMRTIVYELIQPANDNTLKWVKSDDLCDYLFRDFGIIVSAEEAVLRILRCGSNDIEFTMKAYDSIIRLFV